MTIFELYKKCIKGECTPEEASQVEQWLKEHPGAFESEMLSEVVEMESDRPLPADVREEMLSRFRQKGLRVGEGFERGGMVPVKTSRRKVRWMAAAAMVIAALAGVWFYQTHGMKHRPADWATIENNSNGVKLVILPDSSRIWLNAFASIRYTMSADKQSARIVDLMGEAYFKVYSRKGQVFMVRTGDVQTRVLGTEFNVEAYPDERMIRICLQEGKVQVNCLDGGGRETDVRVLEPGQAAVYQKDSSRLSIGRTVADKPQAWIHEELVLNDAPLGDALLRIGRKYNKKIVFDTEQAKRFRHITACYKKMDLEQVLKQLGFTCDFSFKKDSSIYKVFFGRGAGL